MAPRAQLLTRLAVAGRVLWAVLTLVIVEFVACAVSLTPVALAWTCFLDRMPASPLWRGPVVAAAIVPSYVVFAVCLMFISPAATRVLRWRTPEDANMRIDEMDWPLLQWVRYGASIHIVRVIAGTWFRGTPLWTAHLRWSGARIGKHVYVNSLMVTDYNLLQLDDGVVVGGGVHMSGHTVEAGIVKTARVHLHRDVTIGLGSVIEIGVEIGPQAQVGALSFVPKHAKLAGGRVYAGVPAVPLVHAR